MKLVTIQHKKVLELLLKGITYENDFKYITSSSFDDITDKQEKEEQDKIHSYQVLMRHYNYASPPIFCCIPEKRVSFEGTKISRYSILLELEVPDDFINFHLHFRWKNICNYISTGRYTAEKDEEAKQALEYRDVDCGLAMQAVIPFIYPEWLIGVYKIPKDFDKFFKYGNTLHRLDYLNDAIILKNKEAY